MIVWQNNMGVQSSTRPQRVRLEDRTTRTNEDITDQLLDELGWAQVSIADTTIDGNVAIDTATTGN
jgi:hypothetical protein